MREAPLSQWLPIFIPLKEYSTGAIFPMTWNIEYTDRYKENIPRADALYDQHLALIKQEGINDGEEIL
jgi:hypothetical protein